jgi:integrase
MFNTKTVKDALDHAWNLKWSKAKGAHAKEYLKNKVESEIGGVRLSRLDYNRIEQWVLELQEADKAPATIKSRLYCLSFALRLAVKKKWISAVPPLPEVEASGAKLRWLQDEPDEEAMILKACGALAPDACRVMEWAIVFLLDTGCRLSELLKLRVSGISKYGVLFEDRKADDNLRVPLTARAKEAIESLLDDPYWMARVRGANADKKRCRSAQNWMTHQFTIVRDKCGLSDVSLHTLRHTCASRLVQAGVSLYEVRKLLGHSSIKVTERYAHLAPTGLDRAVSILERRALPNKVTHIRR